MNCKTSAFCIAFNEFNAYGEVGLITDDRQVVNRKVAEPSREREALGVNSVGQNLRTTREEGAGAHLL